MRVLDRIKSLFGRQAKSAEKGPISVVLLLNEPAAITEEVLRQAAAHAWGREFDPARNEFIVLNGPLGILTFEGRMIHLIRVPKPYFDDPEGAARAAKELRLQKAIRDQTAWMSLDLLQPQNPAGPEKDECYRQICSLAAQLVDDSCLAVYIPQTGDIRVYDSALREALASNNPLKQIKHAEYVPVVPIEGTDAALEKAVAEARRRWPEFVQAFNTRKKGQRFSVKAKFSDGQNTEWMWVIVSEIRGDTVAGELGNEPVGVKGLHEGAPVKVPAAELGDWIYGDKKQMVGGFSVKVLANALKGKSS
ncbi:MAG TPA: DUF2314 domain-containing protein [Candidatus Acidoferrum sp.]|nr:DUF2314 domain-containing protein [Candidatus Acidoferrum sp.]